MVASEGFCARPRGVSVLCRAARTLCSICDRLAEYIERFSTDFLRNTKNTAMMPINATNGPARMYGIGADYQGSVRRLDPGLSDAELVSQSPKWHFMTASNRRWSTPACAATTLRWARCHS